MSDDNVVRLNRRPPEKVIGICSQRLIERGSELNDPIIVGNACSIQIAMKELTGSSDFLPDDVEHGSSGGNRNRNVG